MRCPVCHKVPAACKCPAAVEIRKKKFGKGVAISGVIHALDNSEQADFERHKRVILNDAGRRDQAARKRERLQGIRKRD